MCVSSSLRLLGVGVTSDNRSPARTTGTDPRFPPAACRQTESKEPKRCPGRRGLKCNELNLRRKKIVGANTGKAGRRRCGLRTDSCCHMPKQYDFAPLAARARARVLPPG